MKLYSASFKEKIDLTYFVSDTDNLAELERLGRKFLIEESDLIIRCVLVNEISDIDCVLPDARKKIPKGIKEAITIEDFIKDKGEYMLYLKLKEKFEKLL